MNEFKTGDYVAVHLKVGQIVNAHQWGHITYLVHFSKNDIGHYCYYELRHATSIEAVHFIAKCICDNDFPRVKDHSYDLG